MNIFERIKHRYYLSRKSTFRVEITETKCNKEICNYYYKILPKKGFIKSERIYGKFTAWCNPDRITNIDFRDREEFYADNSLTIVESYHGLSNKVCEKCLEKTNCKKYKYFLERSAQNESNGNN